MEFGLQERQAEGLFGGEVEEDGALGDACGLGHVGHLQVVEALGGHQRAGHLEQRLEALFLGGLAAGPGFDDHGSLNR
jgi:hypothetical protein